MRFFLKYVRGNDILCVIFGIRTVVVATRATGLIPCLAIRKVFAVTVVAIFTCINVEIRVAHVTPARLVKAVAVATVAV